MSGEPRYSCFASLVGPACSVDRRLRGPLRCDREGNPGLAEAVDRRGFVDRGGRVVRCDPCDSRQAGARAACGPVPGRAARDGLRESSSPSPVHPARTELDSSHSPGRSGRSTTLAPPVDSTRRRSLVRAQVSPTTKRPLSTGRVAVSGDAKVPIRFAALALLVSGTPLNSSRWSPWERSGRALRDRGFLRADLPHGKDLDPTSLAGSCASSSPRRAR